MNKADLINEISMGAGITKAQALSALNVFLESTSKALEKGEKVTIVGFGTFDISRHKQRRGRNPQNGNNIVIQARNVVRFKAGNQLATKVQSDS
ncbi:MAG: HU family DNA-binding protein [Bacteroidia bacterium]|nr:HU family DNA-binding protein [Bacteroidia bacterium]